MLKCMNKLQIRVFVAFKKLPNTMDALRNTFSLCSHCFVAAEEQGL